MFVRNPYKSLSRTFVIDTRIREVTNLSNTDIKRQSHAVGVPVDETYSSQQVVVGPTGYQLPATKGCLFIETAMPIILQLGTASIIIEGQFVFTGKMDQCVLVCDEQQRVSIVQY